MFCFCFRSAKTSFFARLASSEAMTKNRTRDPCAAPARAAGAPLRCGRPRRSPGGSGSVRVDEMASHRRQRGPPCGRHGSSKNLGISSECCASRCDEPHHTGSVLGVTLARHRIQNGACAAHGARRGIPQPDRLLAPLARRPGVEGVRRESPCARVAHWSCDAGRRVCWWKRRSRASASAGMNTLDNQL